MRFGEKREMEKRQHWEGVQAKGGVGPAALLISL